MGKIKDLSGQTFKDLEVLNFAYTKNGKAWFLCQCSCENKLIVKGVSLTKGERTHCGCKAEKRGRKPGTKNKKKDTESFASVDGAKYPEKKTNIQPTTTSDSALQGMRIEEINGLAREYGMNYGKFRAMVDSLGYIPNNPKQKDGETNV